MTGRCAAALASYGVALAARDWPQVRAVLADDLVVTLLHTGEVLDVEAFVGLNRDYPGAWVLEVDEVVDGGARAVLRTHTTIGDQTWHAASLASADAAGRLVEITEVWTEAVTAPPVHRPSSPSSPSSHPTPAGGAP